MLNLTMEDFRDNVDEIAMLYELLKPKEIGCESEEEARYFNSHNIVAIYTDLFIV